MTPKELASIAVSCGKTDLLNLLTKMKFHSEETPVTATPWLVETLTKYAFDQLCQLITQERKRHNGLANRKITAYEDTYHITCKGSRFILTMNDINSSLLKWIPEDMDEILHEFSRILTDRQALAEEFITDFHTSIKAGTVAQTTVNTVFKDLLEKEQGTIEITCRRDGIWYCQLHSKAKQATFSFLSGAEGIFNDGERVLSRLHQKQGQSYVG